MILTNLFLISCLFYCVSGCMVNIQKLPVKQPLYIDVTTNTIVYPTINSNTANIVLNPLEKIDLSCPGLGNNLIIGGISGPQSSLFECVSGTTFTPAGSNVGVDILTVTCKNDIPWIEIRDTTHTCRPYQTLPTAGYIINIVYEVQNIDDLQQYSVCFDHSSLRTGYVDSVLYEANALFHTAAPSPSFRQGSWFDDERVNELYEVKNQIDTFNITFERDDYITSNKYLDRGHLVPRADFMFPQQQRSTFTYLNCAPQWNTFNRNNWRFLERDLRNYIHRIRTRTNIRTGTIGTLSLPDVNNNNKRICLQMNGGVCKVPVPLLFYKRVNDIINKSQITFYGLNNPFAKLADAMAIAADFCKTDLCAPGPNKLPWVTFDTRSVDKGFIFCC